MQTRTMAGTMLYLAPECIPQTGETLKDVMSRITGAVDVYALRLVLR